MPLRKELPETDLEVGSRLRAIQICFYASVSISLSIFIYVPLNINAYEHGLVRVL